MSEVFQQAAANAAIGIITVIGVLVLLSVFIWLFGKINMALNNAGNGKEAAREVFKRGDEADEEELAAVIAAAIAAAEADAAVPHGTGGYFVSSVRRVRKRF